MHDGGTVWSLHGQFAAQRTSEAGSAGPEFAPATEKEDDLEVLSDLYVQGYLTTTILAFKNILDWMALDEELLACFEEQGSP